MEYLKMVRWSPYVVGIGIGLLNCLALLFSDKTIGCSSAYARTSGMIERLFRGNKVLEKVYYKKVPPDIDWGWMLVLGVVLGAFISAKFSGVFQLQEVPGKWVEAFGYTPIIRGFVAFIGGVVMGIGARWAGGCTSGHGISGTMQLSVSSWLAAICFFIGGVATAMLIF